MELLPLCKERELGAGSPSRSGPWESSLHGQRTTASRLEPRACSFCLSGEFSRGEVKLVHGRGGSEKKGRGLD